MILIGVEFKEWRGDRLNWEIRCHDLGAFNLIVGDNAQGKTRLFNIMKFVRDINQGINQNFESAGRVESHFWFMDGDVKIEYELKLGFALGLGKPLFNETVIRGDKVLFSRNRKMLLDESSDKEIREFFLPENVSAIFSLVDKKFSTIGKIRSFLERMLFLEANRFSSSEILFAPNAEIIDTKGKMIGSVLTTWKQNNNPAYKELTSEFERIFGFVEPGSIVPRKISFPGVVQPVDLLTMKESAGSLEIPQHEWSDGMIRVLCLLSLLVSSFKAKDGQVSSPTMVFVDEIENGLDFKTLQKVISFYQDHSNITQILISSHSPVVCNMVKPEDWRISRRLGSKIELQAPDKKDLELRSRNENLLLDSWEFYQRNIAAQRPTN